jgi:hypothetical protein
MDLLLLTLHSILSPSDRVAEAEYPELLSSLHITGRTDADADVTNQNGCPSDVDEAFVFEDPAPGLLGKENSPLELDEPEPEVPVALAGPTAVAAVAVAVAEQHRQTGSFVDQALALHQARVQKLRQQRLEQQQRQQQCQQLQKKLQQPFVEYYLSRTGGASASSKSGQPFLFKVQAGELYRSERPELPQLASSALEQQRAEEANSCHPAGVAVESVVRVASTRQREAREGEIEGPQSPGSSVAAALGDAADLSDDDADGGHVLFFDQGVGVAQTGQLSDSNSLCDAATATITTDVATTLDTCVANAGDSTLQDMGDESIGRGQQQRQSEGHAGKTVSMSPHPPKSTAPRQAREETAAVAAEVSGAGALDARSKRVAPRPPTHTHTHARSQNKKNASKLQDLSSPSHPHALYSAFQNQNQNQNHEKASMQPQGIAPRPWLPQPQQQPSHPQTQTQTQEPLLSNINTNTNTNSNKPPGTSSLPRRGKWDPNTAAGILAAAVVDSSESGGAIISSSPSPCVQMPTILAEEYGVQYAAMRLPYLPTGAEHEDEVQPLSVPLAALTRRDQQLLQQRQRREQDEDEAEKKKKKKKKKKDDESESESEMSHIQALLKQQAPGRPNNTNITSAMASGTSGGDHGSDAAFPAPVAVAVAVAVGSNEKGPGSPIQPRRPLSQQPQPQPQPQSQPQSQSQSQPRPPQAPQSRPRRSQQQQKQQQKQQQVPLSELVRPQRMVYKKVHDQGGLSAHSARALHFAVQGAARIDATEPSSSSSSSTHKHVREPTTSARAKLAF